MGGDSIRIRRGAAGAYFWADYGWDGKRFGRLYSSHTHEHVAGGWGGSADMLVDSCLGGDTNKQQQRFWFYLLLTVARVG